MTDIIKQIDDALIEVQHEQIPCSDGDFYMYSNGKHKTITAALTVLQKIASGDDWFEIDGDYPAPRDKEVLVQFDEPFFGKIKKEVASGCWHTDLDDLDDLGREIGLCFSHPVLVAPRFKKVLRATHWKHIDGAKHIQMLMEREMNNEI